MSIENSLERIADALELLADQGGIIDTDDHMVTEAPKPVPVAAPASPVATAPSTPSRLVTAPAPPAASVAVPPAEAMTPTDLNTALLAELARLGNDRAHIDAAMGTFGVTSITQLTPDQYQPLIDAVKAIVI
tara:strand:+ start:6009 stop:6404 length:396 start_codon:yes stop_codon:yes gene_type:complete